MKTLLAFVLLTSTATGAVQRSAWVTVGDSITYGYAHDPTPYPARLAALIEVPVVNMGVGGETAANINTRFTNYALPFPYRGVIFEECINDLIAGTGGAICWAATEAAADVALAAGMHVILVTAMPCGNYSGWSAPKETQRGIYNAALISYAAAHPGVVRVVNLNTVVSDNGTSIRASDDYGDGLHLNGTGMQNLAAAAAGLIQ